MLSQVCWQTRPASGLASESQVVGSRQVGVNAARPQMICCLLIMFGLVKNHFEGSHSQVNLGTLILSTLYEIQANIFIRERKNAALLFLPGLSFASLVSMNYSSLIIDFMVSQYVVDKCRALIAKGMQIHLGL